MNRSSLTAAQKHRIFRDALSFVLLPEGFVYRYNRFIRVHPGCATLIVALSLGRMWSDIIVEALPAATYGYAFDPKEPANRLAGRVSSFARRATTDDAVAKAIKVQAEFENGWFDALFGVFTKYLFDPFVHIHDAASLIDFNERFASVMIPGITLRSWGTFVQVGDFDRARESVRRLSDMTGALLVDYQQKLREFDPDWSRRMGFIDHKGFLKSRISDIQADLDFYRNVVQLLEKGDQRSLEALINDLIAVNEAPLREALPQFFK